MTNEEIVKQTHPKAYLYMNRSLREVRRPRTKQDKPAMVNYVMLSSVHYTAEEAWADAAKRINPNG